MTALIVLVAVALSGSWTGAACSCGLFPADTLLAHSDAVFFGVVIDVSVKWETFQPASGESYKFPAEHKAEFRVLQSWKEPDPNPVDSSLLGQLRRAIGRLTRWIRGLPGPDTYTLVVRSGGGADDCGIPFQEGDGYIVFASTDADGQLFTSVCSGTWGYRDFPYESAEVHMKYHLATLGPPPNDYRLPADTAGYQSPTRYTFEQKRKMLQLAAFYILDWEPRVEESDGGDRFQILYRPMRDDDWVSLGFIDQDLVLEGKWGEVNAALREMQQIQCERWPGSNWKCNWPRTASERR